MSERHAICGAACTAILIAAGCATVGKGSNTAASQIGRPVRPSMCVNVDKTCPNAGDLKRFCTTSNTTSFVGPAVIADYPDGVSSDGRGPYTPGTEGVNVSLVQAFAVVKATSPRQLKINLNKPVRGSGAVKLGTVVDSGGVNPEGIRFSFAIYTATMTLGLENQSLHDIPVGQSAPAAQVNVYFHINGTLHLLQMGPQPWLHCHSQKPPVNGNGTSLGTVYRAGATKWVVDLPAGSVGRLFDLSNITKATPSAVIDRGLYYTHLRYEIGK